MAKITCKYCLKLVEESNYCSNCGHKLIPINDILRRGIEFNSVGEEIVCVYFKKDNIIKSAMHVSRYHDNFKTIINDWLLLGLISVK